MWAFLQPISARIYFGKTASHRKRARLVQSRGASPQAYWMSVKAAQRRGCAKRAFCGVCFLMPGGLKAGRCLRVDKPTPLSFRGAKRRGNPHLFRRKPAKSAGFVRLADVNDKKTGQAARRLPCFLMVPVTGLEPVRCRQRWILSPLRLPIPSHRQMLPAHYTVNGAGLQDKFTRRRR